MGIIEILLALIFGVGVGIGVGKLGASISQKIATKMLLKRLHEVLEGKRDNKFDLDGKMVEVNKFRLSGDDGKEYVIDLKGEVLNTEKENPIQETEEKTRENTLVK